MPNYYDAQGNLQGAAGTPAIASLTAVATGTGTVLDGGVLHTAPVLGVTAGAGVSAGVVLLEGSLDGTNWFSMGATNSVTTSAPGTTVVQSSNTARFLRARITTPIVGGTVTALVGWGA